MWTSPDEARSDFILAAAAALIGPIVLRLLLRVAPFLGEGVLGIALMPAFTFSFTGLVPLLLARYRGEGFAAFGLDVPREGIGVGFICAAPIVVLGILESWAVPGTSLVEAFGGTLGTLARVDPADSVRFALVFLAGFVGNTMLFTFLTVKARQGFAPNEMGQLEALRTFGTIAAAAGLVLGLAIVAFGPTSWLPIVLEPVAVFALILVVDRFIDTNARTTRAAILGPAIVALLLRLDLLGGAFLVTLRTGALAAALIIAVAVLVESRRYAWAVVPLFAAITFYGTNIQP